MAAILAAAAAGPAQASTVIGAAQARQQAPPAAQQPAAGQPSRDDAEQRGHVIPDEPRRQEPAPGPTPAPPSTPPVSANPVRAVSPAVPAAAPQRPELPRTGWSDGAALAFFGLMLAAAGRCLRRAIA
jgi:hypothetical protein